MQCKGQNRKVVKMMQDIYNVSFFDLQRKRSMRKLSQDSLERRRQFDREWAWRRLRGQQRWGKQFQLERARATIFNGERRGDPAKERGGRELCRPTDEEPRQQTDTKRRGGRGGCGSMIDEWARQDGERRVGVGRMIGQVSERARIRTIDFVLLAIFKIRSRNSRKKVLPVLVFPDPWVFCFLVFVFWALSGPSPTAPGLLDCHY
jgi:hypothetical protein